MALPLAAAAAPAHVRRFYLELVRHRRAVPGVRPVEVLSRPPFLAALARMGAMAREGGVALRIAALVELDGGDPRATADGVRHAASALGEHGVGLDLWVQLEDDRTRFLNAGTAARFRAHLSGLLDELERERPPGIGLALDVEPAAELLTAAWRLSAARRAPRGLPRAAAGVLQQALGAARQGPGAIAELKRLEADLEARGLPVHVAVLPSLIARRQGTGLRRWLLGCPIVDEAGRPLLGRPAPMCYVTLLRRGRADRRLERATLRRWAGRHARRFGPGDEPLAVVLGALSEGVMGDEPVYEALHEVESDLSLVLELGFRDVGFFSLEGLLFGPEGDPTASGFAPARQDWERWARALLAR